MKKSIVLAALAALAMPAMAAGQNWLATQASTPDGGKRVGNPAAEKKLIEFVSYTCPHCGHFFQEADGAIKLALVQPGKASVEVRHVIRDPIDATAVALANCGDPKKFWGNHDMFFAQQDKWLGKVQQTTQAQRQRWQTGPMPDRLKAIAGDLGFYGMMATRGYSRAQADQCLGDVKKLQALAQQSEAAATKYGVSGTPSFVLNGKLLDGVHSWDTLQKALN
ncbi:DsbA family protein [Tsuneonella sp. HG222]